MALFRAEFQPASGSEDDAVDAIRSNHYMHYKVGRLTWLILTSGDQGLDPEDVQSDLNNQLTIDQGQFKVSGPRQEDVQLMETTEVIFHN